MLKFLGVSLWVLQVKGTYLGKRAWYPAETPFVTLLLGTHLPLKGVKIREKRVPESTKNRMRKGSFESKKLDSIQGSAGKNDFVQQCAY